MKSMGNTNADWGVCGFTSSFYAMWKLEKAARGRLINAPEPFNVLAEIKTYLRMLQAEGNQTALQAIEKFCQSFGEPFAKFTVDGYCDRISAAVQRSDIEIKSDELFGIGIPPDYVADYLRRMWGYTSTVIEVPAGSDPGGEAIIGMTVEGSKTLYNGLVHYMYRGKNLIYSWGGDPFSTIEAAAQSGAGDLAWQIGWVIKIGPKS
jgi:hypothetical protein